MAITKSFYLTKIIGQDGKIGETAISADVPLGTEDYATIDNLPATGNQIGDQAFVASNNKLYIWNGSGWYSIALINATPTWDSGGLPEAAYDLDSIGGTATTITLAATDPDGFPIQWSYLVTDSGNDLATITNDSNGTFTITAKSLADILSAGYDSEGGTFDVTFRASDGNNLATALSEFTISFAAGGTQAQGSNYGYVSGGYSGPISTIDKFSFASDGNSTSVGNITLARYFLTGQSSSEYGYSSGGFEPSNGNNNTIDKFPFASDGNATDVGNLTVGRYALSGQSSIDYGYSSGGSGNPQNPPWKNIIDKFPFAADGNATDVGDLPWMNYAPAGQSSIESGYNSGGRALPPGLALSTIDKFPFASNGNATAIGNLTAARYWLMGQSSSEYGYSSGGDTQASRIDKFPFATDANATIVGDLTVGKARASSQSSTKSGYTTGGGPLSGVGTVIDKFPFSADTNATDVGDLTSGRYMTAGQQY
jgi:hypothetical protein